MYKIYFRKKQKKSDPKIYLLISTWKIYALMHTSFDFDM